MEKPAFSLSDKIGSLFHREPNNLPQADIDSVPQDEEIVLFSSESPLPNPFLTSHIVEAIRRERQAGNEMGE